MSGSSHAALLQRAIAAERGRQTFVTVAVDGRLIDVIELTADQLSIGRSSTCAIVVHDERVSRLHAQLLRLPGGWTVEDDGLSTNGTWLNGRRLLARARLSDGDVITIGSAAVTFRAPAPQTQANSTVLDTPVLGKLRMTPAQRKVLVELSRPCFGSEVASPATNQAIASELFLSVDTVKAHLKALFVQFEVGDLPNNAKRARLVEIALRHGVLVDVDFVRRGHP